MLLNCGVGEDSWESLGLQGGPTSPSQRKSVLNVHWKDWCWGWNSNTLATWCEELTYWGKKKKPWCWERLKAGGEGDDRGRDGWMASWIQWTWVWVNSRSWWWTGKPGILQSMGSQRIGHDWATELNWTGRLLLCYERHWHSWTPEERNSIWGQWQDDRSEILCNKVFSKYKRDRENFWHRHQKGAERVSPC